MTLQAIQDFYPEDVAICYGCGRNNAHGLHIRTLWDGEKGTFRFNPQPYHTAFPGVVYGGLIASLIDCHSVGTAVAAAYDADGRPPGSEPEIHFVTGKLTVSYLRPTPLGPELLLVARIRDMHPRKATVICSVYAEDRQCAQGEITAVRVASRRDRLAAHER